MDRRFKECVRRLLPRSVKQHRILAGPLRGTAIVTSWHDYPAALLGRTERELIGWFQRNVGPGETWLDIGAHYGYTAIALSKLVGPSGRVFAFEPATATAGCIARATSINYLTQLTVIPLALGESGGVSLEHLAEVRGMFDSTVPQGGRHGSFLQTSLDWLWPQLSRGTGTIDGIKIDVQGMEIAVIRGMSALLREQRPKLVIELHSGVARDILIPLIEAAGYALPGLCVESRRGSLAGCYKDDLSYAFYKSGSDAPIFRDHQAKFQSAELHQRP